jgi:integrase
MKKRADGRYVKVVDGKSFYGSSEREVYRKILEYTAKKESGSTFAEVADKWWSEVYDSYAAQTLRGYKPAYARAVQELGDDFVKDITPMDMSSIFKRMALQGFTKKTISNQRIIYNQIFDYAVVSGEILYNPCASVKLPSNAKKSTVVKPATTDEELLILNSDHPWLFPFFALLSGLRKQEILALQWDDIDFDNDIISVTKAVEHIGKRPSIKVTKTESGTREVPLLQMLKEKLLPLRSSGSSYVFSDDNGKTPLSEHRFERLYKDYCRDTGISCSSRQLRHSFATVAVEEEVSPKDLQNALGHADITTTMNVYAAARKKSIKKVAEKLNSKYSPK